MQYAACARLLAELGFGKVESGAWLVHPAAFEALRCRRARDGRAVFSARIVQRDSFDRALWKCSKPASGADEFQLEPVVGLEAAAFRSVLGTLSDDDVAAVIARRKDLTAARKRVLLDARMGQGEFRRAVEQLEQGCRATGVLDRRHVRATHIKPWRLANDVEKLDGANGLLLSPHLKHLFDAGYVSFSADGRLLISKYLNPAVVEKWRLDAAPRAVPFNAAQQRYLAVHHARVFEQERRPRLPR